MTNVNKTLYIPLYGKSYVSSKGIILHDKKAEEIWNKEGFSLKGKSNSKWLAYYMAMRSATFDEWVRREMLNDAEAIVLHIGCGMDSRIERVGASRHQWYDMDFPEVINERKKYYKETDCYRMIPADMRKADWKNQIAGNQSAIIVLEGVSMYFKPDELTQLLLSFVNHFMSVKVLMDCYTVRAAKVSKYKNPINNVGVTLVYGYENPHELGDVAGLLFVKEHNMTPEKFIDELVGMEKKIFKYLFAGRIAKAMYRMYEYKST